MLISKQISIFIYIVAGMMVIAGIFAWENTTKDQSIMLYFVDAIDHNSRLIDTMEKTIQKVNKDIWTSRKRIGLREDIKSFSNRVEDMKLPKDKLNLEQVYEIENEYLLLLQSKKEYSETEKGIIIQSLTNKQVQYFKHLRTVEEAFMKNDISVIADRIGGVRIASVVLSVTFFFLVLYVGYFLKHKLEKSVAELKRTARAIENGNYSRKVSFKGDTEFSSLGKSLNQLAGRAQQAEIIEKQNVQLEDLNQALKLKNDSLDSFVYRVSHDLKAPVINIQSLLKVIKKQVEGVEDEVLKKTTFFMEKTTEKLEQTIFDLLEVSRIERNLKTRKECLSFKDIMEEVLMENTNDIERYHVRIIQDFEQMPAVYFSRANMKSILGNLVTNAVKYHSKERPSKVEIKSYPVDGFVCLSVSDNGIGIDLGAHQEKLFGMFNRFHNHVEGSGVGLYIVKKIVDENSGHLEIESVVDQGTTMRVLLPQEKIKADPIIESAFI